MRTSGSFSVPAEKYLEDMWNVYQITFGGMREKIATKTVYNYEEFLREVTNESVYKILIYDEKDTVVAYTTLTNELQVVPWIEPLFYEKRYPEAYSKKCLWFIMCIAALPRTDSIRPYTLTLFAKIFEYLDKECELLCFDAFDHSVEKNSWPELATKMANKLSPVHLQKIYNHRYYAMERVENDEAN